MAWGYALCDFFSSSTGHPVNFASTFAPSLPFQLSLPLFSFQCLTLLSKWLRNNASLLSNKRCLGTFRVARWFIFKPKIPIWEKFGRPWNGECCYIL
jgi:hypothetical protein